MNALVHHETRQLATVTQYTFEEKERAAQVIAQSGLFGVKNAVQALALMLVAEAEGEHPASVAQDYDIIQGKGTRKTHSVLARFQAMGGKVEWHELNHTRAEATFSHPKGGSLRLDWTIEQAKQAGLTGKDNWKGYARAMLRARLIAEGVRAVYPAAIGGWQVPEEAMGPQLDAGERHMGSADVVQPGASTAGMQSAGAATEVVHYDQAEFDKNFPAWEKAIKNGLDPETCIKKVQTKAPLTDEQKKKIRAAKPAAEPAAPAAAASPAPGADPDPFTPPTYAEVAGKLHGAVKAKNRDDFFAAGDLIKAVQDEQQRGELQRFFDELEANFAKE